MAILSLQAVCKEYASDGQRVRALDGVTLDVEEGEFVALVGRSGCGKSTLLHVCGRDGFPHSRRTCASKGRDTSVLDDARQTQLRREKVGFVFQSFQLLHTLTVQENVELPLLLAGKPDAREDRRERLHWVELDGLGGALSASAFRRANATRGDRAGACAFAADFAGR